MFIILAKTILFRYFLENVKRICHHEFVPTRGDILRTRARTTGAVEFTFKDRGNVFTIVDVGGQRSQRMKWLELFVVDNSSKEKL